MKSSIFFWLLTVLGSGCSTIQVTVPMRNTDIEMNGVSVGAAAPNVPITVEVGPGFSPVPYRVLDNGVVVAEGELPRTEPVVWAMVASGAGALCCIPTLAVGGLCLANPFVLIGSGLTALGAVVAGAGSPLAAFGSFSVLTLPCVAGCGVVGGTPLLGLLAAQGPSPEVVLRAEATAPVAKEGASHAAAF
jgi:hypothetical protein